jgi:Na+/proline symporter
MQLEFIDWVIVAVFFAAIVLIGLLVSRRAGSSSAEFFLGGRTMPWWLLGVSMVACTFSCDTPNLVTGMVRGGGVVANWAWWAFLITGMVTVFIYAQLWRRSKVMTDLEFYELRYSGKSAAFIRCFRSLYLGVFFNCLIMGSVTLAAIKIGQVIFDVEPWVAVVVGSIGVVIYAVAGGIKSCIWADFFQYSIAMSGAVYAAIVACRQPEVGSLSNLLQHPDVIAKLSWMPDFSTWLAWVPLLLLPVAVQWWAVWYPGAEPGGGGYIAQRMLAAKDEKNAIGATLFFNFMHYAMRPWPWIIVALASILCYPTLESIKSSFPGIDPIYLKEDIAYPVMISRLNPGFLGLVVASLIAAYMSTIGTHLNWGSSYAVNDFYKRFWRKNASEKELVLAGRICTVVLMIIAAFFALTFLESATQAFKILLLSGAGTGAIYILRWFWWRINAWTEIVAMIVATVVAFWLVLGVGAEGTLRWYVGSGSVKDRVFVIDDEATVESITAYRTNAAPGIDLLAEELDNLADEWRKARKESKKKLKTARAIYNAELDKLDDELHKARSESNEKQNAARAIYDAEIDKLDAGWRIAESKSNENRDAARALYDAKLDELKAARDAASTTTLVNQSKDVAWRTDLDEFYTVQKQWQLDRDNKRRIKSGLEEQQLSDVKVDFGGIVKGGKIYIYHPDIANLEFSVQLLACVVLVTAAWLVTTLVTPPADKKTLRSFYKLCHPGGPGWKKVVEDAKKDGEDIDQKNAIGDWKLPVQILCVFLGCVAIYSSLFAVGNFVYGNVKWGAILIVLAAAATFALFKSFRKIGVESSD